MTNMEAKMMKNKEIIETLQAAQKIVKDANLDQEYRQLAFEKTFECLIHIHLPNKMISEIEKPLQDNPMVVHTTKPFPGFLRQTQSKSHANKVLTIAYYYVKNNKLTFTKEDIETAYQEAFLPKSKNTSVEINGLIGRGLLMSTQEKVEGKKSFKITLDGMDYVEKELIKNDKK